MQNLLLLHGALGTKEQMVPLANLLENKYHIHLLNFRGHGGKPFSQVDFSIALFADEVLGYLKQQQIDRINIFGYSMGGYVAMYLAKHHPAFIGKIITLATKFYWDEGIAAKEVKMLDGEVIEQKVPAFANQLKERHRPNDWKTVLIKTREMLLNLGQNNVLDLPDYRNITADCLLLLGDQDKMVTIEETQNVAGALPRGNFKLLPQTPHPIEQVNNQVLATLITKFVNYTL